MNAKKWERNDLPLDLLKDVLGEINTVTPEGPGVHYLSVTGTESWSRGEYYAVWDDIPIISTEAKGYGLPVEDCPGLLLYPLSKDDSGWRIIQYELYRYCTANKLPLPEKDSLLNAALYGQEIHPEYFGTYPVPAVTPWGYTLRHKVLDNGIYWLETSWCRYALAVCAPIWQELSSAAVKIAVQIRYDIESGVDGPLLFDERTYCIPIWELMKRRRKWDAKIVDKPALMNAIWQSFPEYAAAYNAQVQQGLHDAAGLLFGAVGVRADLNPNMDDTISISPQAGVDFLLF